MDPKVKVGIAHKRPEYLQKHFYSHPALLSKTDYLLASIASFNTQQTSLLNTTHFFHCFHSEFRLWNGSENILI